VQICLAEDHVLQRPWGPWLEGRCGEAENEANGPKERLRLDKTIQSCPKLVKYSLSIIDIVIGLQPDPLSTSWQHESSGTNGGKHAWCEVFFLCTAAASSLGGKWLSLARQDDQTRSTVYLKLKGCKTYRGEGQLN
jgi:hypothetical protein